MKSKTLISVAALTLFAALATPVQLAAQHTRYKLVDLTLGGPNSFLSGPGAQNLNNRGTFVAFGNTLASNPNPGCFVPFGNPPDCFVEQPFVLRNGVIDPLRVLPGGMNSQTDWISSSGLIAGWSENGIIDPMTGLPEGRAVLWTRDGKIIDLGTLAGGTESLATAINSRGQVVGFSTNDVPDPFSLNGFPTQTRAFLWQNGAMQDLNTLGGPDALAAVINERGQVAGFSYTNSTPNSDNGPNCPANVPTTEPFLWDEKGGMIDLGTLGGTCGFGNLFVNSRGQVVGTSSLAGNATHHGFLWDRGTLTDLRTLGGINSEAIFVSNSGLVVGRADFSLESTAHHAFLWKNGAMTDLGTLGPCENSTAFAVNSKGEAVGDTGRCPGGGGGPSFFSEHGRPMVDINTLVLPGSDIEVVDAFDINERGEIAGAGVLLANGDTHAVLLIPASQEEIAAADAISPTAHSTTPQSRPMRNGIGAAWRDRFEQRYRMLGQGTPRD
jgi:probable HAF family extracellular repeat protein